MESEDGWVNVTSRESLKQAKVPERSSAKGRNPRGRGAGGGPKGKRGDGEKREGEERNEGGSETLNPQRWRIAAQKIRAEQEAAVAAFLASEASASVATNQSAYRLGGFAFLPGFPPPPHCCLYSNTIFELYSNISPASPPPYPPPHCRAPPTTPFSPAVSNRCRLRLVHWGRRFLLVRRLHSCCQGTAG